MSAWLGLGPKTPKVVKYSGLQTNTSQLDLPIPIFWGQRRLSINVIWVGDFSRHKQGGKGGKGGGGKGTGTYTYSAATVCALCEGEVDGIVTVFEDGSSSTTTTLSKLNQTLFNGTAIQSPWSYLTTNHPTEALSYAYTAYLASPKMDLGASASIPSISYECTRLPFSYSKSSDGWAPEGGSPTIGYDVLLSDVIPDLLNNTQYGFDIPSEAIGDTAQYADYQRAQGLVFSPLLVSQESAISIIDRWAQLSNSWIYWSGTEVNFVPLGDIEITANGAHYVPDNDVAYELGLEDFIGNDPPLSVKRRDGSDCYNRTRVQINDRTKGYVTNPIEFKDQALVDTFGLQDNSSVSADEICDPNVGAIVAQLVGRRVAYIRNIYEFKTSYRFILVLPGCILTLTEPNIGLDAQPVRVISVEEDDDGNLSFVAEEFPGVIGNYTGLPLPDTTGTRPTDQNADPGDVNSPSIVEPDNSFTGGVPRILISASGGAEWGGAYVWVSFDAANYISIGNITQPAYQGLLTADLPIGSDPDTVNTLSVDCTESLAVPIGGVTHGDANQKRTLSTVSEQPSGGLIPNTYEELSFGDVVATGTYSADLTYLRRALYGSPDADHFIGDQFTLIDVSLNQGCTIAYDLPVQYIGQTIYFKFQSYNLYTNALQDMADVVEYSYVPLGVGFGSGSGGVPSAPTGAGAVAGNGQNIIFWNSNPATDNVTSYVVYRANGLSAPFLSSTDIWQGSATSYADSTITSGADYTYFVQALNAIGGGGNSGGINVTSSTITSALQLRGGTPGRAPLALEELFDILMRTGDAFPINLTGSLLACEVAPTSNWTMTLYKNGVSIGTGTILAAATTGAFTFASAITFVNGDQFKCVAPALDATMSGVSYTIVGTRTQ